MSKAGRKERDPDPYLPADLEPIFGVLSIPDPVSGRIIKLKPQPDPVTRQANPHAFYYLKQDGYFEFLDVRELQNWKEFDQEHPAYRDSEVLKREWAAQQKVMDYLGKFLELPLYLSFKVFLATHRDAEWEEYHRARDSHVKDKIIEAVNQGLLDLSG